MYVGSSIVQECVAILGYVDPSSPGGISPAGTGFLVNYEGFGYLLTARHVAAELGEFPFCLRVNKPNGGVTFEMKDEAKWIVPEDETVDLAAIEFNPVGEERLEKRFINWTMLLTSDRMKQLDIQPGCICYVVGLFKFLQGTEKNLPLVYSGNVASLDTEERVPVYDEPSNKTQQCRVYLIEVHGIDGLSGSPVLVRQTRSITYQNQNGETQKALVASDNLDLLGLYSGAWFLPPDQAVAKAYRAKRGEIVPVGLGMVVPSQRIVELLEMPSVKASRETVTKRRIG